MAKEDVGNMVVRVGMDNSGFQNGISNLNRQMRIVQSEFKVAASELTNFGKGTDGLKLKADSLSKQLELQKQKVTALEQAHKTSAEKKGVDAKATQDLEIKLNKTKASMNNMERQLEKTNADIAMQSSRWTKLGTTLSTVGTKMNAVGNKMSSVGRSLSMRLTAPLLAVGTASAKLASDMNESINKVDVAFKNNSEEVKQWSDTTLEKFGIAKGTALDMAALFGDMATSMGIGTDRAADMSSKLVGLAGDLASFKNISLKEAETALNAIFTGETESIKRLGVVMTQANLQQFAYSQGIQKNIKDMTESEKVQLRYNYVLEKTVNAQGDFERTGGGAANQGRLFTESMKELGATIGQQILPIVTPIIAKLNTIIKQFSQLDDGTKRTILVIAAVAAAIGPVIVVLGSLISAVGTITTTFSAASLAIGKAGGIMAVLTGPVGIAIGAITGAIAVGVLLYKNWDTIKEKAAELKDVFVEKFTIIKEKIIEIFNNVLDFFKELPENLYSLGVEMFEGFKNGIINTSTAVKNAIINTIKSGLEYIKNLPNQMYNWGKDMISGFINGIKSMLKKLKSTITGIANAIKAKLHFSRPDEGPLADYETWMPDFMQGLADGIEKSKYKVANAVNGLATDMNINASLTPAAAVAGGNSLTIINQGTIVGTGGMEEFANVVSRKIAGKYGGSTGGKW